MLPVVFAWYNKGSRSGHNLFTIADSGGQTLLPDQQGKPGTKAAGTFKPTGPFGFKLDYEFTDDKLNNSGGAGHHIRAYPLRDHTGAIIPNTYLFGLDYSPGAAATGENFDYQDEVWIATNIKPAGN